MGDQIHDALAPLMPYVLALMFLAGGVVIIWNGYANLVSMRKKRETWRPVQGTVVDFIERQTDPGRGKTRPVYAPVCKYAFDGRQYRCTSKIAANPPGYHVGDSIPLVVNPVNPNDADVLHRSLPLFTYGEIALGVLVLALGVFIANLVWTGQMAFD